MKNIVSCSFGKDSTAMLHLLLEQNIKIHEVIYFETGWEFPQLEEHIKKVEKNTGLVVTRLRYYRHFNELLRRYGWPPGGHVAGGWCTACKTTTCNKFIRYAIQKDKNSTECIGFTTDEIHRTKRKSITKKKWQVSFPLVDANMSERDALTYCKNLGYDFGGLYDVFNRVSCFCCPKAGQKRIEILRSEFPDLYDCYLEMNSIAEENKK